jgi:uncharacterized protein (TIGR00369 family)
MTKPDQNLKPLRHSSQNRCFGCGPANPAGLHLEFFLAADGTAVCLPIVSDAFEGPAGLVHGGVIATMIDETMSKAVRASGFTSMTRQMEIEYLRPVPSGAAIRLEGRVVRSEGRKHWTEARLTDEKGVVLAKGNALFIEVPPSRIAPPAVPSPED